MKLVMVSSMDESGDGDGGLLEELNKRMAAAVEAHNRTPDPEMGGLSPEQVSALLASDWETSDSVLQLNGNLPLDWVNGSVYFRDSRTLLSAISEAGGVKATPKGNLPRSMVAELVDATGDEEIRERTRFVSKVINEHDYFPLHLVRVLCQVAGLVRIYKGRFTVPKKYQPLLDEERAGVLYRTLFATFFRKFNIAYLVHSGPELPGLQSRALYTLYRLGIAARQWRAPVDLYPDVFLPQVRADVERAVANHPYLKADELAARHLILPLVDWNLLEAQVEKKRSYSETVAVRVTPLYDAFFRFRL